jgi:DNA primase
MSLSKETIDQIKERMDITEVVSDFVSLKKKGQNLWACCPFHNEKSPSFSVSPNKQFFKCFGCGKAGDAITFIEEIEGLSYIDSLKFLAGKYGIEIEERESTPEDQLRQNERESLFIVLNFANDVFKNLLWESEDGKAIGLSYFKERAFSESTIRKFELGYTVDQWDYLMKLAVQNSYSEDILEKAGLILVNEAKKYDRFRGRVIFPIHNTSGKVVGFGARTLSKDKKQPKYINSPESVVYHKSNILYGLFQGKSAIRNADNCYLVEGYTDVISMHQSGVENVVSSSGTSLTEEQIKLISRFTKNITVLFDGDEAGIKASLRGIDMILEQDMNVRVVMFPTGEDPDSYSRKVGSTAFTEYLEKESQDFISFKTKLFVNEAGNDPVKKAGTIRNIVESIAKVPDPIKRTVYLKECSKLLEIGEDILIAEINKITIQQRRAKNREEMEFPLPPEAIPDHSDNQRKSSQSLEEVIKLQEKESVRLLINYGFNELEDEGSLADFILASLVDVEFTTPHYAELINLYKIELAKGKIPDVQYFIDNTKEELKEVVIDLVSTRYEISERWEHEHEILIPHESEILDKMVVTNILRLKFRIVQMLIRENMLELKNSSSDDDMIILMNRHKNFKVTEMELAKQLGVVVAR